MIYEKHGLWMKKFVDNEFGKGRIDCLGKGRERLVGLVQEWSGDR